MAQLKTKILLLNGSQGTWEQLASYVLSKGEPAVEYVTAPNVVDENHNVTTKNLKAVKVKIGDGVTKYSDLPYVGDEIAENLAALVTRVGNAETNIEKLSDTVSTLGNAVFEIEATTLAEVEGITEADKIVSYIATNYSDKTVKEGNIAVVKRVVGNGYSYTAYVFNGTVWAAMDGNYSADDIYFNEDMMVTTNIGYIKTTDGSGTIPSAGKNLTEVFEAMFVKEMEPDNNTQPSVSFASVTSGSKEVGTEVTPSYNADFSAGSYEYGPTTGITLKATDTSTSGWTVVAKNGSTTVATKYTETGSFDKFIVDDSTSYTITATANHTAGATPNTNKGVPSTTVAAFAAGTKSKTSGAVTGYRSYFYGAVTKDPSELTSADIRALTNGGNYNASKNIEIKANGATNIKAFVIAIPATNTRKGITKAESTAGMTVDVTGSYALSTTIKPMVADCRGTKEDGALNNGKEYKLWIWQPAEVDSGTIHKITMG